MPPTEQRFVELCEAVTRDTLRRLHAGELSVTPDLDAELVHALRVRVARDEGRHAEEVTVEGGWRVDAGNSKLLCNNDWSRLV